MNRTVQIYVADADKVLRRIDLFKDETISLTDGIQDVRDIGKVFTEFTQSFSVPASKTNNKIFKHYYNADITDGYDNRFLSNARIEINNTPFKEGFVSLQGVNMKDNNADSYRITFYGKTVDLKNIIGSDKISSLPFNSSLNTQYSQALVRNRLTADPSSSDIIAPLITHTQRLYYDSNEDIRDTGNLYDHGGGGTHIHGVRWDNLKYAIRVHTIVEAIESKYPQIEFTDDFFNTTNDRYYNLFMWMHREKGSILKDNQLYSTVIDSYDDILTATYIDLNLSDDSRLDVLRRIDSIKLTTSTTSSESYNVIIYHNGVELCSRNGMSGNQTDLSIPFAEFIDDGYLTVKVTSLGAVDFNTFTLTFFDNTPSAPAAQDVDGLSVAVTTTVDFIVSEQIPNMKVLDFLTGLFKMFNLTAFFQDDGKIYVDTLDEFYVDKTSLGNPYDIDKYVDTTKHQVDSALPFREISFKYKDTGTLLAVKHKELNESLSGDDWGEDTYNHTNQSIQNNFKGGTYKVEPQFGHMKFERLLNNDDLTQTTIQWGYSADDDFDESTGNYGSYIGSPLLFYPVYTSMSANSISYVTSILTDGTFDDHTSVSGSINLPSNSTTFNSNSKNIHFKNEINEYTNTNDFTDTLFNQYYQSYVTQMFSRSNRIIKLKAYLPVSILVQYTLADKFIYKGRKHQINKITTNLKTGESEIELLNIVIE